MIGPLTNCPLRDVGHSIKDVFIKTRGNLLVASPACIPLWSF